MIKSKHKKIFHKVKIICIAVISVIILLIAGITWFKYYSQTDKAALLVDGIPITQQELACVMHIKETETLSYFESKYNAAQNNTENFWNTQFGDEEETPLERLRKMAVDEAIRIKIMQITAQDYGLVKYIDYHYFLESFKSEYERRQDPDTQVFGARNITEAHYFKEVISNLEEKLKTAMINDGTLMIDIDAAQNYYLENMTKFKTRDTLKTNIVSGMMRIDAANPSYSEYTEEDISDISMTVKKIMEETDQGADPEKTVQKQNEANDLYEYSYRDVDLDEEYISMDPIGYENYSALLESIPEGGWSEIEYAGMYEGVKAVRLVERIKTEYLEFNNAFPLIEKNMINNYFIAHFKNKRDAYKNERRITYYQDVIKKVALPY